MKLFLLLSALPLLSHADDWPRFLGPTGSAVVAKADVPLTWSDTENLVWKAPLPGPGSSSPIVVGDKVFVTCWSGYGDREGATDMTRLQRHLVCLHLADGKTLWNTAVASVGEEDPYQGFITEHGYATSTPASDGERVYVFFGKTGALAFDMATGKQVWQMPLGTQSGRMRWGSAGSPILYKDSIIINASDESRAVHALDKKTGKQMWKAEGENLEMAYGTPVLIDHDGTTDLVFSVPEEVWGLNPETGKLRWYAVHQLPGNVSPSVVQGQGVIYVFGGFPSTGAAAIKLGGKGDLTAANILWRTNTSSYVPTPVLHNDHLFVVNDQGFALCLDAKTGKDVFRERVIEGGARGRGKPFYASPVLIGDRLYCVSRKNGTYVIAADPSGYRQLAHNVFGGDTSQFNATPAVTGNRLILRSDQAVYCIGGK